MDCGDRFTSSKLMRTAVAVSLQLFTSSKLMRTAVAASSLPLSLDCDGEVGGTFMDPYDIIAQN